MKINAHSNLRNALPLCYQDSPAIDISLVSAGI